MRRTWETAIYELNKGLNSPVKGEYGKTKTVLKHSLHKIEEEI